MIPQEYIERAARRMADPESRTGMLFCCLVMKEAFHRERPSYEEALSALEASLDEQRPSHMPRTIWFEDHQ